MRIRFQGIEMSLPAGTCLDALLVRQNAPRPGEAVFLNCRRLGADEWPRTILREGDEIETAPLVAGG
ncbi:MAG: thiamine biosynthesis protein ThiS [Myxococcales bacterium]|nr:thiamine biosynthesis protein ThiS [Myxococcales bacterium]